MKFYQTNNMGTSVILDKNNLPQKLEKLSSYCKDITNLKFDKLTVLYPSVHKKSDGSILWVCQCECGNYVLRSGADLKRNGNHHCGRHFKEDQQDYSNKLRTELNGQIFNNLLVIDFDHVEDKRIFLKCQCLKCNNITIVRKDSLISGHKFSCGCIHSKGKSYITSLLQQKNIEFKQEYIFKELCDKDNLRFDFAIFKNNVLLGLIEYQGIQHFSSSTGWNSESHLKKTQLHDKMKFDFCKENNIKLYYITYEDNIEEKLKEILNGLYSE